MANIHLMIIALTVSQVVTQLIMPTETNEATTVALSPQQAHWLLAV
jgi:hypothetical protein